MLGIPINTAGSAVLVFFFFFFLNWTQDVTLIVVGKNGSAAAAVVTLKQMQADKKSIFDHKEMLSRRTLIGEVVTVVAQEVK